MTPLFGRMSRRGPTKKAYSDSLRSGVGESSRGRSGCGGRSLVSALLPEPLASPASAMAVSPFASALPSPRALSVAASAANASPLPAAPGSSDELLEQAAPVKASVRRRARSGRCIAVTSDG